ncbi:Murein hydrolase activator EnvC [Marinobacter salarius]|mgnify:FL=1|uniref:Murein hydrolase activator EnvC n=2 Tax=Marinobacteraceae TaxID=2887365 RepID=A0A1W6K6Q0_9GAMM|nr:murein hydrolase activator EnvC [Marinobacter salarius]AZR41880.1 murein hydrolase activator EnvC [Marinobacter salarius]VVT19815.1 Murein hydrolase activator EnvC [Marinobacter salarius]VXB87177.1 Murein hydrolase activator EnvC [Marinobacter salarius]
MILRLWLAVAMLAVVTPALAEQQVTPGQIEDLKEEIADIDEWLADAEEDRSSLEQQLSGLEQEIGRLTRERRELRQQAREQQLRLTELGKEETELTRVLESQRDSLKKQIRAAWMEGDAPAVKVLLNEIDPDKVARTMTYYEYLSRDTIDRLEAFAANLRQLKETQKQVKAGRMRLAELEENVADRQQKLSSSKKEREQTLAALKTDISNRLSEREELEEDRKRLEKLLREVEEAIANIPTPNESDPFGSLKNKLPWPAEGKIVRNFGDSYASGKLKHNGLLINTAEEGDVKAVHYGRVVFANWLRGFGLITILDHGDGYMTLYGHSSSLFTSPGDWVEAGEAIAQAGRTGGTNDPAVYFEVRHNGKPDNPRRWLGNR